jgi:hypothetical protein
MDHDQRFKTLLRHFYADFLRLFFADWAARLDLSKVEWLDKELHSQPPEGPTHSLDMVARVEAKMPVGSANDTAPWLVLVHVEIESPDQTTRIKPRLPEYYYHLRGTHQLSVLPIVIYLNVQLDGIGIDVYSEHFWELEVMTFRYLYVGLPGLDGIKYVQGDNWLGVALAALMRIPKDRVAWLGAEALLRLGGAPLNPHERFLLAECVQAYLPLDEKQKQEYDQLLQSDRYVEARTMNKTVYEEGLEKGLEKGRREIILALLKERFGRVSERLRNHVESLDKEALVQLVAKAARSESLEDAGLDQYRD